MYIEKIRINKFRVLEDIEVRFQKPEGESADPETGNVVNVVAGVNGTGKTSLLEAIYLAFENDSDFETTMEYGEIFACGIEVYQSPQRKKINEMQKQSGKEPRASLLDARVYLEQKYKDTLVPAIYPSVVIFPSHQDFPYSTVQKVDLKYKFVREIEVDKLLGNAEFYIKEFILSIERGSNESDPKNRTQLAIEKFNAYFDGLGLLTNLEDLDSSRFNKPVFRNAANELVTIDQLSDGEKQLYGRVIALMILEPKNSVILIDEPEIALHPAWQQKIMQIYSRIGTNNQFIVATHSPQVIASAPYQNRILLRKDEGKIIPIHCSQPPIGIDVNSILAEVMGLERTLPKKVEDLHKTYRALVEASEEETPEAKKVKGEILLHESNDSKFMQEMRFLIRLRGKK